MDQAYNLVMNNNTRSLNIAFGWEIITTVTDKNIEPDISANTNQ